MYVYEDNLVVNVAVESCYQETYLYSVLIYYLLFQICHLYILGAVKFIIAKSHFPSEISSEEI